MPYNSSAASRVLLLSYFSYRQTNYLTAGSLLQNCEKKKQHVPFSQNKDLILFAGVSSYFKSWFLKQAKMYLMNVTRTNSSRTNRWSLGGRAAEGTAENSVSLTVIGQKINNSFAHCGCNQLKAKKKLNISSSLTNEHSEFGVLLLCCLLWLI